MPLSAIYTGKIQCFKNADRLIEGVEEDAKSFYKKGSRSASTRLRKALQKTKSLAQEVRIEILDKRKSK